MSKKHLLTITLISVAVAVVGVIVLKIMGCSNQIIIISSVVGGIAGALSPTFLAKRRK